MEVEGRFHIEDIKTMSPDDLMHCWMFGFEVADFGSAGAEKEINLRLTKLKAIREKVVEMRDEAYKKATDTTESDHVQTVFAGHHDALDEVLKLIDGEETG